MHEPLKRRAVVPGSVRLLSALPRKETAIGSETGGEAKAHAFSDLEKTPVPVRDTQAATAFTVHQDSGSRTALIRDTNGKELTAVAGYWFAWYAFHPGTRVFGR